MSLFCPHAMRLALSKKCPHPCQLYRARVDSTLTSRLVSTTHVTHTEAGTAVTPDNGRNDYREKFIPITRLSIIRYLVEEKNFLVEDEKQRLAHFSRCLDRAVSNQYQGVLGELKHLFDPINPDKDTLHTRRVSRREKLDNEFSLLQQLQLVMAKANFHELPKRTVEAHLADHMTSEGVRVSVDWNRYEVLRFWVLGHEQPSVSLGLTDRIVSAVMRRAPRQADQHYKRVIVAIRLKKDSKLTLKAFKEVPVQSLESLLPDGTIKMSQFDRGVLVTSVAVGAVGVLAKAVSYAASLHVDWMLVLISITGLIGFRAWSMYRNKHNDYVIKVTRMLYYKNIANNRSLLAVLVDRAQDESVKEALLTYLFLSTSDPSHSRPLTSHQHTGGLTQEELVAAVEDWMEKRTGARIHFDPTESVTLLKNLGILSEKGGNLKVMSMEAASKFLPSVPVPMSASGYDGDIMDGFDRNPYLETEEEYQHDEKKSGKYGWF